MMKGKKREKLIHTALVVVLLGSSFLFTTILAQSVKATTQLVVTGQWEYKDRDGSWVGARSCLVELIKGDDPFQHITWAYTSSVIGHEGEFEFPAVDNPGNQGIQVRIYSGALYGGGVVLCLHENGIDYEYA